MANETFKCPSCGGYLVFDAEDQKWSCPFCDSHFDEKELLAKDAQYAKEAEQHAPQTEPTAAGERQVVYHCPSCGSQIMTDETTVATQCYYCHSPVVLQGKLTDDMRPDSVLPFSIGKDKAKKSFMDWVAKKRFMPKGFFSAAEIEAMQGVYYPHFITDVTVDGAFDGEGRNVSVVDTPKYVVTNTQHFHVRREGVVDFHGVMRPALKSVNRKLADGIHPFPLEELKPFSGAYLSGYLAERRDIDAADVQPDVEEEVQRYVEPLLTDTLHYDSHSGTTTARVRDVKTRYALLPTWTLTYPNKADKQNPYYYVMNGRTGEVCGKLPIDSGKLNLTGLLVGAGVFLVMCALSYFLF